MKSFVRLVAISALASLLSFGFGMRAAQADNYVFNNVGESTGNINFSFTTPANDTLTGTINYTVTAISDGSITFNVAVDNTSTTGTNQGIVAFGFVTTTPEITTTTVSNLTNPIVFTGALSGVNAPEFNTVELCVHNGGNCPSAANPRLTESAGIDTFSLTLNTVANGTNTFTMTTSFIRFAGDLGSFTFGTNGGPGPTLPLPASLTLVGAGMIAWSLARRLTRQ